MQRSKCQHFTKIPGANGTMTPPTAPPHWGDAPKTGTSPQKILGLTREVTDSCPLQGTAGMRSGERDRSGGGEEAEDGGTGTGHRRIDGAAGVHLRLEGSDFGVRGEDASLEVVDHRVAPLCHGQCQCLAQK